MENLERKFTEKISHIEKTCTILQEKSEINDKNTLIKLVNLENKLETQYEIHQQTMNNYQQKLSSVESSHKENEIKLKETLEKSQQSVSYS
jgi:uncharacterized protein YlxW (UPF0749 family)